MIQLAWVPVQTIFCPRITAEAMLLEQQRPSGTYDDSGAETYVIASRCCSHDIECNMNDHIHCRWSVKVGDDPFDGADFVVPSNALRPVARMPSQAAELYGTPVSTKR